MQDPSGMITKQKMKDQASVLMQVEVIFTSLRSSFSHESFLKTFSRPRMM